MDSSITWLSSQSKLIISRDLSEVALQGTIGRWWYILYSGLVMGKGALCVGGVLVCMDRWTEDLAITVLQRIFSSLEYNGPTQTWQYHRAYTDWVLWTHLDYTQQVSQPGLTDHVYICDLSVGVREGAREEDGWLIISLWIISFGNWQPPASSRWRLKPEVYVNWLQQEPGQVFKCSNSSICII